ncbi:ribosome maturation factor RimP [Leptospira sp. GIMC2001]|uniref:ribosome maturation factor RimP n=1 Tax=Leptospira sp. GIMC2001 TaxID=1513297 RepID=UPI002349DF63|nr:ribosome maturation factor RimP [Leptospira sp. GIMC2001]WCL48091.1 ribosome maturation factor RimP [Leptospira sp. GIMC2001]
MAISEEQIRDILGEILVHPLALFSFKIKTSSLSMIMEVVLDHLENQYGSVSVQDCEEVSRELNKRMEILDPEADYQLTVQSAGAERTLRIPGDLHRFQGLLASLEILNEESKSTLGVYKILEVKDDKIRLEPFHGKGKKKKDSSGIWETDIGKVTKGKLYLHI